MIPTDVEKYVGCAFGAAKQTEALAMLETAVNHDGSTTGPRLFHRAVFASAGSIERLRMKVELLKRDYRDIIVEDEKAPMGGQLVKLRNLNEPIPDEA